jgi:hypothetical protein
LPFEHAPRAPTSFQNFELAVLMQHKFEIEVRVFRRRLPAFPWLLEAVIISKAKNCSA